MMAGMNVIQEKQVVAAPHDDHLHDVASELVTNGSIELSTRVDRRITQAAELLPRGTSVYVPWLPGRNMSSNLDAMQKLHAAGFEPVPHLAARSIGTSGELHEYLERLVRDFGVHRVLIVGGDRATALGPYPDSAAVLREGALAGVGIHEVGVAGYPEGHPKIPAVALHDDLQLKQELAARHGLGLEVVTQFSFAPSRIIEYCAMLARTAPEVPVYVGMAGPTRNSQLLQYARYCGVSASLRALASLGVKAATLASHTDPDEQLAALAHHCAARESCNVIGVHLFSFGGFVASAQWMRRQCRPA